MLGQVGRGPRDREDTFLAGLVDPVRIESSGLATGMGDARKNEAVRILYLAALADALERRVAVRSCRRTPRLAGTRTASPTSKMVWTLKKPRPCGLKGSIPMTLRLSALRPSAMGIVPTATARRSVGRHGLGDEF